MVYKTSGTEIYILANYYNTLLSMFLPCSQGNWNISSVIGKGPLYPLMWFLLLTSKSVKSYSAATLTPPY